MIPLSRLYGSSERGVSSSAWFHHLGMCETVLLADPDLLNAVKGDLHLDSLAFYNVAAVHPVRYMLAADARGFQVVMASNPNLYSTLWTQVMNGGVKIDPSLASTALSFMVDAAEIVFNDLNPRLTGTKEILFFGHGLAAGVAAIVREKVRNVGKRAGYLFTSSSPRVFSEASYNAITLPASRLHATDDAFCVAPPANAMDSWRPTAGPLPELYSVGLPRVAPNLGENRSRVLIELLEANDPVGWPEGIPADAVIAGTPGYYAIHMWNAMSPTEQGESIEWFNLFNDTFGFALRRSLS